MPSIPVLRRNDVSSISDVPAESANGSEAKIWIIVAITAGIALLATIFVVAVLTYYRRKWYLEEKEKDPYLSPKEFLRRRRMNAAARQEEEELQRAMMIRKSLASRSDTSTQADTQSLDMPEGLPLGLKEDWKEWEARMRRESSTSTNRHPSSSAVPGLPIPDESRSRSPSRSPLLRGQSPPPIVSLPRLVSFQRSTQEKTYQAHATASKGSTS